MITKMRRLAAGLLFLIILKALPIHAQTITPIRGVNGEVHAIATDAQGNVYVGGEFTQAGNINARNIAKWNPTTRTWSRLTESTVNDGLDGVNGIVKTIAIDYNGDVYVGGAFSNAGGHSFTNIAQWHPDSANPTWTPLGGALRANTPGGGVVNAICVGDGYIYAGGSFTKAGNLTVNNVARWPIGGGTWVGMGDPGGTVNCMEIWPYSPDNYYVYLFAGGHLRATAWNGTTWDIQNGAPNDPDNDIHVGGLNVLKTDADNKLLVGGSFYLSSQVPEEGDKPCLAEWDGTSFTYVPMNGNNEIYAICGFGGDMIVGGTFFSGTDTIPQYWAQNVAKMSPASLAPSFPIWDVLGIGNDNGVNYAPVRAVSQVGSRYVYVGGFFNEAAGGQCAQNVACYDNVTGTWSALAENEAPTIAITSPMEGAAAAEPATFKVTASAVDDCTITKVEFYQDGVLVGTVTTAPYEVSLTGLAEGSYTFTAKAYDNDGASTVSAPVTISVIAPVTTTLSAVSYSASTDNFQFTISGATGAWVDVLSTEDFVTWTHRGTVMLAGGSASFVAENLSSVSHRFYTVKHGTANSINTVGFIKKVVPGKQGTATQGWAMIANQLRQPGGAANSMDVVVQGQVDQMTAMKYDPVNGWTLTTTYFGAPDNTWDPVPNWNPGEGCFVSNPTTEDVTLIFAGEVPKDYSNTGMPTTANQFALVGSAIPIAGTLSSLVFPAKEDDVIYRWDAGIQNYEETTTYFIDEGVGFWFPEPTHDYEVGEAFFLKSGRTESRDWTQHLTIEPPLVHLTGPKNGSVYYLPGINKPVLTAVASSSVAISSVQFYANGTLIGTATAGPTAYSYTWNPTVQGVYTITAKATDAQNVSTYSAPVSIQVYIGR